MGRGGEVEVSGSGESIEYEGEEKGGKGRKGNRGGKGGGREGGGRC